MLNKNNKLLKNSVPELKYKRTLKKMETLLRKQKGTLL